MTTRQDIDRLDLRCANGSALSLTVVGDLREQLRRLWQPFVTAPREAGTGSGRGTPSGETVRLDVVDLATTCAEVNRAMVARLPWPAVHAGVVALPSGAVAFPAVSGAGKSTLTAALCLAGADYLSDEALVLDDSDEAARIRVLPYPKPVALSPWSATAVGIAGREVGSGEVMAESTDRELLFAPDAFTRLSGPAPLAHILLPVRGDGVPRLVQVPRPGALAVLLELSFNHFHDPRRFLLAAAAAVNSAQVWRLHLGEPMSTARLVLDSLG